MSLATDINEDLLGMLDAKAADKSEAFSREEVQSVAALTGALGHLAWVLTTKPIPKHRRYITAVAYASRVMQHAYGVYCMVRVGNTISAEVVSRAALEASFVVGALANDENFSESQDFYLRLLFKSTLGKKKLLEEFLKTADTLSSEQLRQCRDRLSKLQTELEDLKIHQLSKTSAVARAAKMEDFYVREYASQSRIFHSDLEMVVADHVAFEEEKAHLRGMIFSLTDARFLIANLIAVVMETATAMARLLQVEVPEHERMRIAEISVFYGQTVREASF